MRIYLIVIHILQASFITLFASSVPPPEPERLSRVSIEGRVVDITSAGVAGARVTAESDRGACANSTSGVTGDFVLSLAPGSYRLKVTANGFVDTTRNLVATGGPTIPVVTQLQISPRAESVTVTDSASYQLVATSSATKIPTPVINIPQSVSIVTGDLVRDQMMMSIGDVVRYVPGVTAIQGENNRDQVVIRGNSSSADFFLTAFARMFSTIAICTTSNEWKF